MDKIAEGLIRQYKEHEGLVIGGNDFLYTNQLEEHPCSYFVYCYGFVLASLGVDTIFLENHYITEPIQTRGFIGSIIHCAQLYGFRVIGIELKGNPEQYYEHTGKQVDRRMTTVAYDEKSRLIQLNQIATDIVHWKSRPDQWESSFMIDSGISAQIEKASGKSWIPQRRKGKWLLFCGMSHVNEEKFCKGLKDMLGVPGIGINFGKSIGFTKNKPFRDTNSSYEKPTDYMIEMTIDPIRSAKFHINTSIFGLLYSLLFFFNAYQNMMNEFGFKVTTGDLWKKNKKHLYQKNYQDMLMYMMEVDPYVFNPEYDFIGSILSDTLTEVCSRKMVQSSLAGMTKEDMSELVDRLVLFIEQQTKSSFTLEHYPYLLDMLFLERKTLPEETEPVRFLSALKKKYHKQLTRPENHIYQLLFIMNSIGMDLPKTRMIHLMFK
jgi:hypothetical protein